MSRLILALAATVVASSGLAAGDHSRHARRATCQVDVAAFDGRGHERPVRRFSATAPAVLFKGELSKRGGETSQLLFDVFNPHGQRYQVLVAEERVAQGRRGRRFERPGRELGASMAVAGSSIAWTSMYGRWRVEPRIEGEQEPCGRPEFFVIRP